VFHKGKGLILNHAQKNGYLKPVNTTYCYVILHYIIDMIIFTKAIITGTG